jgi:hypothetical protein
LVAAGGDLGGGSENIVVQPTAIQGNLIGRDQGGPQGVGCSDSGTMYTLTRGDVHGVAIPIQDGREIEKAQNGFGVGDAGDPAYTLDTTGAQSIAFSQNQREEVRILGDCAGALSGPGTHQATYVAQAADVRTGRLVGEISGTICAKGSGGWSNHMINPVLVPHAFYSTGGTHGLESKPDVCPPLKVGSSIGIPSPPSVMYTLDMQGCKGNANVGDGSVSPTLGRPRGTDCHAVAIPIDGRNAMRDPEKHDEVNRQGVGVGNAGDPAHTVTTACVHAVAVGVGNAGDPTHAVCIALDEELNPTVNIAGTILRGGDGGRHAAVGIPVAFSCKEDASDASDIAPTMRAMSHDQSHANGGGQLAIAFKPGASADSRSIGASLDCAPTLESGGGGNNKPAVATAMVVRRLLPVECERLQGFPDGWTDVPYRGKPAPDGPRYKALGNSMAVPCMAWIGRRIQFAKESEQ